MNDIFSKELQLQKYNSDFRLNIDKYFSIIDKSIQETDIDSLNKLEKRIVDIYGQILVQTKAINTLNKDINDLVKRNVDIINESHDFALQLFVALRESSHSEKIRAIYKNLTLNHDILNHHIHMKEQILDNGLEKSLHRLELGAADSARMFYASFSSLMFLGVLFGFIIFYNLISPLNNITNFIKKLSIKNQIDPDVPYADRKDEIGDLAKNFRNMIIEVNKSKETILAQKKEAEKSKVALYKSKVKAEESFKAKSEFLANMSHELRTPMHSIIGFAKYGKNKAKRLTAKEQQENFTDIIESGEDLLALINNLLDLSKLESSNIEYEVSENYFPDIVNTVIHELSPLYHEKNLVIKINKKEGKDYNVECDGPKIIQVIRNLVSNAIKFSNDEGLIKINIDRNRVNIKFSVEDQGVGIPKGELSSIFDKFIQSTRTKSGAGGTGLGLSICQEIISKHKGKIKASNGKKGAIFEFTLPIKYKG